MTASTRGKQKLKVLITVKTYPIPSGKYDELVCTAGVTESGDFVRLYPINFRDLPFNQQYKKYQWIEVMAEKHRGRDVRRESYRPDSDTIQIIGELIKSNPGNWIARALCPGEEGALHGGTERSEGGRPDVSGHFQAQEGPRSGDFSR